MRQDAPRNDVDRDNRLLDFDSEAPNTARDEQEPDIAYRNEPDAALGVPVVFFEQGEPVVAFSSKEPDDVGGRDDLEIVFNRQERDVTFGSRELDIQPHGYELPRDNPSLRHPRLPVPKHPMRHGPRGLHARKTGRRSTLTQAPQAVCL